MMRTLRHPNIVLFMGCGMDSSFMYIVTEYMPNASLYDILHNTGVTIDMGTRLNFILDITKGLNFLHTFHPPILHRDIKSKNILVDSKWNCKVADFGLTAFKRGDLRTPDFSGSVCWTAPEVLAGEDFTEQADVYSFGIMLWEILTRQEPYEDISNPNCIALQVTQNQLRPILPDLCPNPYKTLVQNCWQQQSALRPSFKKILTEFPTLEKDLADFIEPVEQYTIQPPQGVVLIIACEINNSHTMWTWNPNVMEESLRVAQGTLHREVSAASGYEVRFKNSVMLVAFNSGIRALSFCAAAQQALLSAEWPAELLQYPCCAPLTIDEVTVFRGLRVSMGVHMCAQEANPATGQVDYVGPEVTRTERIAHYAKGGQVVVTASVFQVVVGIPAVEQLGIFEDLGTVQLKGLGTQDTLYQFSLSGLPRQFPDEAATSILTTTKSYAFNKEEVVRNTFKEVSMPWMVKSSEITLVGDRIGVGNFGEVFKGVWRGQTVAVKRMLQQNIDTITPKHFMLQLKEINILSGLRHPNILFFMCACIEPPNVCVVTEWMEKGSLKDIIVQESLTWAQMKHVAVSVAHGVTFLHESGIIHRDIKSSNVLIGKSWEVKIADFGLSRIKDYNKMMSLCGTPAWTAPEVLLRSAYSEKADVYSFGIMMWELITSKRPFQHMNHLQISRDVTNGVRPPIPKTPGKAPPEYVALMQECWEKLPDVRPAMHEVSQRLTQM
eukprot:TRINITY_DN3924_c0_g1_i1.p1 TRINITY_DN3924_c0_g1~~TRINITY_DN3924_c0_g1_i1.p1  ORF type:complete len:722 (+),score=180.43 TRINITY_DN3924_c0_g1_i1:2032-4197(+)